MQRSTIVIAVAIILVAFLLYRTRKAAPAVAGGKKWTIYGTKGCGWTVKQLDYMKKAGKPHVFVDCEKGGCDGMTAFPTLKGPNGEKIVGYNEV
jgi:hypothetical protein|tara:strand:- start:199 stop:480 length:282 start_codon:yes stop_codon:yes gene_type:complete